VTRYWAMRTDQARREFIWRELQAGRMRQGWGLVPDDNLERLQRLRREGVPLNDWEWEIWRGNRRLLPTEPHGMLIGDVVVLPHMPRSGVWSIVRVTGGYHFAVSDEPNAWDGRHDYGHIRNVELLTDGRGIDPEAESVPDALRAAMRNRQRMWSLDAHEDEVASLLRGAKG
jgi:hypothetical protein